MDIGDSSPSVKSPTYHPRGARFGFIRRWLGGNLSPTSMPLFRSQSSSKLPPPSHSSAIPTQDDLTDSVNTGDSDWGTSVPQSPAPVPRSHRDFPFSPTRVSVGNKMKEKLTFASFLPSKKNGPSVHTPTSAPSTVTFAALPKLSSSRNPSPTPAYDPTSCSDPAHTPAHDATLSATDAEPSPNNAPSTSFAELVVDMVRPSGSSYRQVAMNTPTSSRTPLARGQLSRTLFGRGVGGAGGAGGNYTMSADDDGDCSTSGEDDDDEEGNQDGNDEAVDETKSEEASEEATDSNVQRLNGFYHPLYPQGATV